MRRLIVFGVAVTAILVVSQSATRGLAAISLGDVQGDEQTSIIYDAGNGEVWVDAPWPGFLVLDIDSASGISVDHDNLRLWTWETPSETNILFFSVEPLAGYLSLGYVAKTGLSEDFVANDLTVTGGLDLGYPFGDVDLIYIPEPQTPLQAGDANMDYVFNQLDLVQVQQAAKYLTGEGATWGEGDWDGAPGGEPGSPPVGNGLFDQFDVVAALRTGSYLGGPYAAINKGGVRDDDQTSIIYDPATGEVSVEAAANEHMNSINIDSAAGIFVNWEDAENLNGSWDNASEDNLFFVSFGDPGPTQMFYGNVAQLGLSEDFVASDLTVLGIIDYGGNLGDVDLIYIPEPSTTALLVLGLIGLLHWRRR